MVSADVKWKAVVAYGFMYVKWMQDWRRLQIILGVKRLFVRGLDKWKYKCGGVARMFVAWNPTKILRLFCMKFTRPLTYLWSYKSTPLYRVFDNFWGTRATSPLFLSTPLYKWFVWSKIRWTKKNLNGSLKQILLTFHSTANLSLKTNIWR